MTKEELLATAKEALEFDVLEHGITLPILHKFFETNVCTPKGEFRHTYADVIHEWLEGRSCEFMQSDGSFSKLVEISCLHFKAHNSNPKIRIKPSEPVVKYKYAYVDYDGNVAISDHVTEEYAIAHIINRTKATRLDWSITNE